MLHVLILWCVITFLVVPYSAVYSAEDEVPRWLFPWFIFGTILFLHALRSA